MEDTPRLRSVEVLPVQTDGQDLICLRDPQGLAEHPIFLNKFLAFLALRMNGQNSLRDIQADFVRATGEILPMEHIVRLVEQLDEQGYLESARFRACFQNLVEEFRNSPVRKARHAGSAYAADADGLQQQIDGFFVHPEGPGPGSVPDKERPLRGLVAPHIDLARGGPTYAHGYRRLAGCGGARRFIIFGTCHNPMERRFAVSMKDYETPFGCAETDREFVRRLTAKLPGNCLQDEFAHRAEHSIEFQTIFLQHVLKDREEFKIIPILVGSFHGIHAAGKMPAQDDEVEAMVVGIREVMRELPDGYAVVAGADLAHVGRRFGDPSGPTEYSLREVEREDRKFLELVESGDPEGVSRSIALDDDRRRVCGYPPIYMTLRCLDDPRGEILQYRQWADFEGGAAVTFASVAIF